MAIRYYIHKPSGEKEAVERWENEGGRLGQNHAFERTMRQSVFAA